MNLKHAILRTARLSGFSSAMRRSAWRDSRLAILCYHGVSLDDEHEALPELYVSRAHLRLRLEHLRRHDYEVLSLADGLDRLSTGRLPPRSVALTFDDGTCDFAEVVAPLLHEFAMPATVYVTTYYCDHRWPVFNTAMRYMLWRGRASGANLASIISDAPGSSLLLGSVEQREATWTAISRYIRQNTISAAEKNALLGDVARQVGVAFDSFLANGQFTIMTPEQISRLPTPLIDVQLHTHRHRTPREQDRFAQEINDNRAILQPLVGDRPLSHFCYPGGDYSKKCLPWLEQLGIRSATTCVPGLVSAASHPLLLPRFIDTSLTSDLSFESWLAGVADLLPRRRIFSLDIERA